MGRAPRQFVPGGIYHVHSRGSNRQAIFTYDSDRTDFLFCVERSIARAHASCLAYCLMSNHYHLVIETHDGELSALMRSVNGGYANRFNRRYERDAHLFRNRFGAIHQETHSQFEWTMRYVVMNPVTSGLCAQPDEWRWSSFRSTVGMDAPPRFLDIPRLLSYFGDTADAAVSSLRASLTGRIGV
jgi:putative transposase